MHFFLYSERVLNKIHMLSQLLFEKRHLKDISYQLLYNIIILNATLS